MARESERAAVFPGATAARTIRAGLPILLAFCAAIAGASVAIADQHDTQRFNRGACAAAYPGWVRGLVDAYNEAAIQDPEFVLTKVPVPASYKATPAEELGYRVGLMAGHVLGLQYGEELGRGARTPDAEADFEKMADSTRKLEQHVKQYCGDLAAGLDWETTQMDEAGTATVASLHEAQLAMHLALTTNQEAAGAERAARGVREAEAKGEHAEADAWREVARTTAGWSEDFAKMTKGRAAAGRDEALRALSDATAAADRARKAVEDAGG
ncbi:hypothetical protein [Aurantimonas sp. HBX-1]|uniref:hypothetical protein n=1 Tax=Aurantimonas sp. HBX-1 TaxID=2906072 RepID=UPI001F3F661C|nr:hypothetical protein [Aurantimonas sp. HBX-1]UIJ72684.1 hypothetical protein LXB15_03235 [Aurantimonas sp. HBX-1]